MKWLPVVLFSVMCWAQTSQPIWMQQKCDADLAAWKGENDPQSHGNLSLERLVDRSKELLYCELAYPDAVEKLKWIQQRTDYSDSITLRYQHFLERHKLWTTFLAEDERGER